MVLQPVTGGPAPWCPVLVRVMPGVEPRAAVIYPTLGIIDASVEVTPFSGVSAI